jgi:hypothetical protein
VNFDVSRQNALFESMVARERWCTVKSMVKRRQLSCLAALLLFIFVLTALAAVVLEVSVYSIPCVILAFFAAGLYQASNEPVSIETSERVVKLSRGRAHSFYQADRPW